MDAAQPGDLPRMRLAREDRDEVQVAATGAKCAERGRPDEVEGLQAPGERAISRPTNSSAAACAAAGSTGA